MNEGTYSLLEEWFSWQLGGQILRETLSGLRGEKGQKDGAKQSTTTLPISGRLTPGLQPINLSAGRQAPASCPPDHLSPPAPQIDNAKIQKK